MNVRRLGWAVSLRVQRVGEVLCYISPDVGVWLKCDKVYYRPQGYVATARDSDSHRCVSVSCQLNDIEARRKEKKCLIGEFST